MYAHTHVSNTASTPSNSSVTHACNVKAQIHVRRSVLISFHRNAAEIFKPEVSGQIRLENKKPDGKELLSENMFRTVAHIGLQIYTVFKKMVSFLLWLSLCYD